jgi:sulfotransferase
MLMHANGIVGGPLSAFTQAWFGNHSENPIVVRYESVIERPKEILMEIYQLLGEPYFEHNFLKLAYDAREFDIALGMPGFHKAADKIEVIRRRMLLPPDIFERYNHEFGNDADQSPDNVIFFSTALL